MSDAPTPITAYPVAGGTYFYDPITKTYILNPMAQVTPQQAMEKVEVAKKLGVSSATVTQTHQVAINKIMHKLNLNIEFNRLLEANKSKLPQHLRGEII